MEESALRALTKVVQVMPPRLRHRVDALRAMTVPAVWGRGGPSIDPAVLTTIAQACRDAETLQFTYTAKDAAQTVRHTEPHRLVSLGRRWYLIAYDLTRHDWRSFRLDRLQAPCRTGTRFRPRQLPADDAAAFVRARIENLPGRYAVEAVVHAPAATVGAEVGRWGSVEDIDGQHCRLRMAADSLDWPAIALGALGADFHVVSPREFVDYLRDWSDRFARATAARGRDGRDRLANGR